MTDHSRRPTVRILGTHGVPAAYGGFETAAQNVGLHLHAKGWRVIIYCQVPGNGDIHEDTWHGLQRVLVPESREGWLGTASFDLASIRHVLAHAGGSDVCLTFGYNTGVFNVAQRLRGIPNVINMDGMEWTRRRWGLLRQGILLGNERFAGLVGDVLIADHPHIATYLRRHFGSRRVTTIAYGAHAVDSAPEGPVRDRGLVPGEFATVICRVIPENSVLEIVEAWSRRRRGIRLVVLGSLVDSDDYHTAIQRAASDEVSFLGAIHDPTIVEALRLHSRFYLHGHTVGGTNPSLVEAMGAGNPVIARNNVYNRFVAGAGNRFFDGADDLADLLDLLTNDSTALRSMGAFSRRRFEERYTWAYIGDLYEAALMSAMANRRAHDSAQGSAP